MTNKEDRKKLIEAITNNDDYYKSNVEALNRLEKSLEGVETIQKGQLPKKTAKEFLKELMDEEREKRIQESFNKVVEKNGGALERLAKGIRRS